MTVSELIAYLQTQPQDMRVMIADSVYGYNLLEPTGIYKIAAVPATHPDDCNAAFEANDSDNPSIPPDTLVLAGEDA